MFNPTKETLDLTKQALANGTNDLNKNVTVSTGLTAYDLQAPAKQIYPIITPLRNVIPRVQRVNPGDAARWKQIASLTGSGYDAMGWVPEGQRSGTMSYTADPKSAGYVTLGEEDNISFEAESASKGFEDINATASLRVLQKMMRKEEMGILGGNASLTLSAPTAPSLSAAGSGATLPALTYSVIVVALTFEGYKNASLANGVSTNKVITGAEGKTFTLNGGCSNKSGNTTQAVTLGQTLSATTPVVNGAVAYAWYVGAAASETLQAITTLNSATFAAPLAGGRQAATVVTGDFSKNASYAFDGLLTQTFISNAAASGAYVQSLATGTAGVGTALTSSGRGSINEIDTMLQAMWDNYRISPDVLYVNSQELKNITNKVLAAGTGSLLKYETAASSGMPIAVVAGGTVEFYFNPFSVDGGTKMPVKVHPDLPPGTLMGWSSKLPEWFQSNEVPNVAEVLTRRDYYRMDWPPRTRAREFGVYAEETLAIYAPFALGVINNIANA